jgi:hypothetical protein
MQQDRYLQPHQARQRPATTFEDLLGDVIERAFADGIHDLPGLVQLPERQRPPPKTASRGPRRCIAAS